MNSTRLGFAEERHQDGRGEIIRDAGHVKRKAADLSEIGVRLSAPQECPFTLDDLLSEDFELDEALAKLAAAA